MALSESDNLLKPANLSTTPTVTTGLLLSEHDIHSAPKNMSAISWAAIFSGAAASAALSLILLFLGAGLGLSSVSPWAHQGISASAFGLSTIIWLVVTQVLAAGMGGYLAGRLRIRWAGVDVDEVYFRDTAHGFLSWSVATLITAALLASVIGAIVNNGVQAAATLTAGGLAGSALVKSEREAVEMDYLVTSLFRKDPNQNAATPASQTAHLSDSAQKTAYKAEATSLLINAMSIQSLPPADLTYISQLVSAHTGLTQADAQARVNTIYNNLQTKAGNAELAMKEAADKARKASIYTTLWLFVALLMGAFSASLASTWGGRCRDA